jgi:hypothetical protein
MRFGPLRQSFNVPIGVHHNTNAELACSLLGHEDHMRREVTPIVPPSSSERSVQRSPCCAEVGAQQGKANGTVAWRSSARDGADHR